MHLCRSLQMCHARNCYKTLTFAHFWQGTESLAPATRNNIWTSKRGPGPSVFRTFGFEMCFAPTACTFSTSQLRHWGVLPILTSKCASHRNGMHFFNISTSKSAPTRRCFLHFDFEMCSAPQRCTFSTSQLPKALWDWGALRLLTSKCASRHNRVNFLNIATSTSAPNMRCFVHFDFKMCFAPQRRTCFINPPQPQNIGKTQCFATFLPFRAPGSSFFWLSLLWSSFFFSSPLLFYLAFPAVRTVGSLTSKLASKMAWVTTNMSVPDHPTSSNVYVKQGRSLFDTLAYKSTCSSQFWLHGSSCFKVARWHQQRQSVTRVASSGPILVSAPFPGQSPPFPGQSPPFPCQSPPFPGQTPPFPGQSFQQNLL